MSTTRAPSAAQSARRRGASWHYQPALPINTSPYFSRPLRFAAIVRWVIGSWLPLSERLIILLLSLASAFLFHPAIQTCSEFAPGWIAQIYLRNLFLMCLVAGGLHWYFYIARRQGNDRRYDSRPFATSSRVFSFKSQVRDNMFWTLASGVTVWSLYEVVMMWALARGYLPSLFDPNTEATGWGWLWVGLIIFLLPLWETTHFYLIHRLIHFSPLYKRIHSLHHRNTNVGPWSGLSMHPLEHVIYLSTVLIHFVIPSSPLVIIFHLQYFTLSAATTHTGYQGIAWGDRLLLPLGTFHHQLHHRYFDCNYGGLEVPWDRWAGSFHDGTDEGHAQFLSRQRLGTRGGR